MLSSGQSERLKMVSENYITKLIKVCLRCVYLLFFKYLFSFVVIQPLVHFCDTFLYSTGLGSAVGRLVEYLV